MGRGTLMIAARPKVELEPQDGELDELRILVSWRCLMLLDLGFTIEQAVGLATQRDFDWHKAESLRRRGCPTDLAVRILS